MVPRLTLYRRQHRGAAGSGGNQGQRSLSSGTYRYYAQDHLGTTREQVFFLLHGGGANGKSTFLNTLLAALGPDYALQADPRSFMLSRNDTGPRNDLANLRGVRFVSAIETGDSRQLDEALVKQVTGGDPIRARHLYHEAFQFQPQFKMWLSTNHLPHIRGTDAAIWRRVRLIPFNVSLPPERQDRDLPEKLLREVEGILAWAVEGAVRYIQDELQAPAEVLSATSTYQKNEDVIGRFLTDCMALDPTAQCSKADMYRAYRKWCEDTGEYCLSQHKFSGYLTEHGFDSHKGKKGTRMWIGLSLSISKVA